MPDRFDKFTERARKVLQYAREEAQRLSHNFIGTEHLLLGLVREGDGVAAKVLANLGVDLDKVREAVEAIIGRGDRAVAGDIGLTPRAKRVIELSVDEARRLDHHYIGTEHLLLGVVREGEGVAVGVLESLGVSLDRVRSDVVAVLNGSAAYRPGAGQSQSLRRALDQAVLAARWYEHPALDDDHLLVGVVRERTGLAAQVLAELGVELWRLLAEFEAASAGRTNIASSDDPMYRQSAQAAFVRAEHEAKERNQAPVGTGHLLLALVAHDAGPAALLLQRLGVSADAVRATLESRLAQGDPS